VSKYQLVLKCKSCKHRYKRIVSLDADERIEDYPDPACPKCAKRSMRADAYETASSPLEHGGMDAIVESGRAPGIVGANSMVKAIDQTAEIVMQDYKLSNLKDNVRPGEAMAPRLPQEQQKKADEFFGPKPGAGNKRQQAYMQRMMRKAIGGAYRTNALDVKSVLPDQRVALHRVGVEPVAR
jgi:hypothetical protein